jgi:hypothetical protein
LRGRVEKGTEDTGRARNGGRLGGGGWVRGGEGGGVGGEGDQVSPAFP